MSAVLSALRRYILAPIGLSSPVKLAHNAEASVIVGDGGQRLIDLVKAECPSLYGSSAFYTPFPILGGGHAATIFAAMADFSSVDVLEYERILLRAPDGGTIGIDFTPPFRICPEDDRPILICVHGLTGGSHESYVRSVLGLATAPESAGGLGWRGCVVNYRACAGVELTTPKMFHAGWTEDLRRAIFYLSTRLPNAPLTGVGFSLGANVLTRYLGEEGDRTPLKAGVVLSCPWDLWAGHVALSKSYMGQVYSRAMSSNLRNLMRKHWDVVSCDKRLKMDCIYGNERATLYEFDNQVTRILGGFASVEDYYISQSAVRVLDQVRVPLLGWHAMNDPITAASCLPTDSTNGHFIMATTQAGGHLGTWTGSGKTRWLRKPVAEFLSAVVTADPKPRPHPYTASRDDAGFTIDPDRPEIGFQLLGAETVKSGQVNGDAGVTKGF